MNTADLKQLLIKRIDDALLYLLPAGKPVGNYWHVGSLAGEAGDSLKVCLRGAKAGVWLEGNANGVSGDIIKLWCEVRGRTLKECKSEIEDWLGVPKLSRLHKATNKVYKKPNESEIVPLSSPSAKSVLSYLVKERRIPTEVLGDAGVKAVANWRVRSEEFGPSMAFVSVHNSEPCLVKIVSLKRTERGKKIMSCIPNGRPVLFGMETTLVKQSPGFIVITEGEIDMLSWQAEGVPAVSVPFGAKGELESGLSANDEWIEECWDFLELFHTIYIASDMDKDGDLMAEALANRLGRQRCLRVNLPKKDSNACRVAGISLTPLLESATEIGMNDLRHALDLEKEAMSDNDVIDENSGHPFMGWNLPVSERFNVRPCEGSAVTGFASHGKSNALYQYVAHKVCTHGTHIFIGSFEEPAKRILRLMACHALGHKVETATEEEKKALHDQLFSRIVVHAKMSSCIPVKEFFEYARYAVRRYGCEEVVLDSASCMDFDMEDKEQMGAFAKECQTFWKETNAHLWVVFHPRKGLNEAIPPEKQDIKGSGIVGDLFFNVITFHRVEGQPDHQARMIMSKQKVGGQRPRPLLTYDPTCYRVNPVGHPSPRASYLQLTDDSIEYPE